MKVTESQGITKIGWILLEIIGNFTIRTVTTLDHPKSSGFTGARGGVRA